MTRHLHATPIPAICHECDFEGAGFREITEAELDGSKADAPLALWYCCPECGHHNAYT